MTAAGVAGFIKLFWRLKHKQLPPTINFEKLNEHIDLQDSPFYINSQLQEWKSQGSTRRQGAVSSFGFGGTNAHIVVGEYVPPAEAKLPSTITPNRKSIVPLSARTATQLKQRASELSDFIRKQPSLDLDEIAYTLQVGREPMEERVGFQANSVKQLAEKLDAYIAGQQDTDVYQGQVKRNKENLSIISEDDEVKESIVNKWIAQNKLSKLLDLWVKGLELDWNKLYGAVKPKRIALPTYPFARDRYWIDAATAEQSAARKIAAAVLHPLLHVNSSDLSEQRYSSTFTGNESFVADHRVRTDHNMTEKVLSGVAYLEMARAAVEQASPSRPESMVLELHNAKWERPVIFAENKPSDSRQISIALQADDTDQIDYEIYSHETEQEIVHCHGRAVWNGQPAHARLDVEQLKLQMSARVDSDTVYPALAQMGLHYGPAHQSITALRVGEKQLLAELRIPVIIDAEHNAYVLHPSLLDGALQASAHLTGSTALPLALKFLRVVSACTSKMYAWVHFSCIDAGGSNNQQLDIVLIDLQGNICVEINGLELANEVSMINTPALPLQNSETALVPQVAAAAIAASEAVGKSWDKRSYLCKWEQQPDLQCASSVAHRTVVVICCAPFFDLETTILEAYQQRDCETILIRVAASTERVSRNEWSCGIQDPDGFQKCLQKINRIDAIYFLAMGEQQTASISTQDFADSREANEIQFLRLVKYLQQSGKVEARTDLYILTLNTHSFSQAHNGFMGSGVTGLGYSLAQGNPKFQVRNLDLSLEDMQSPQDRSDLFAMIVNEPSSNRGEAFKLHSGHRYRQTFFKLEWDKTAQPAIRDNGTYVVVGGRGTVGQIITRNLIKKYNAKIVWIGRSPETSEDVQLSLKSFGSLGSAPLYIQAEVTDLGSMQKAVSQIKEKGLQINGGIFSAMVFGNDSLGGISENEFRYAFDIKAQGSWAFYSALKEEPLDFMCFFSSRQGYAFIGASKHSAYGSGITFSDAYVRSLQNTAPFPVGIINWGVWKSSMAGITAESLDALEDQDGFECFERFINELQRNRIYQVLCVGESKLLESLMNCNREELMILTKSPASAYPAKEAHDLGYQISVAQSDGIVRQKLNLTAPVQPMAATQPVSKTRVHTQKVAPAAVSSIGAEEHIRSTILECLSSALKIGPGEIDSDIAFSDYGIDSILGVKFIEGVNQRLAIDLNTAIVFDYSSLDRLSKYVVATYRDQIEARIHQQIASAIVTVETDTASHSEVVLKKRSVRPRRRATSSRQLHGKQAPAMIEARGSEIAVIGMSGMFPKAANVDEFWKNLAEGTDGVEELPAHYLDRRFLSTEKQPGKTRCKWGGVLAERDCFDPLFFNVSPTEAESMNPHQRLILQEGWKAIEDAGYNPKHLSGSQTGVFIGAEPAGYSGGSFTGYSDAIIASRLSYVLNLSGPAFVVNTGCSASGVAIHLACESLRNRETDFALAGGVNACMEQRIQISLDDIGMLSPGGRCRTFDCTADGTIISEAAAVVLLKRLEDAIRDNDLIYGVIAGSGINQDGASNGITSPNGAAQEQLIDRVYNKFGIDPEKISYVEAHGTGTKLGDPVEANALVRAFRKFTSKQGYCALGTAKSHVGHTAAAAGVTGLIKVLLSMEHHLIPRLLHFKELNPLIALNGSPFYISSEESEWKSQDGSPRMAALNSFGHSGTNAHLVVREYTDAKVHHGITDVPQPGDAIIVPLSAKTAEQLRQKATDLLRFIRGSKKSMDHQCHAVDLTGLAFTLQTGREAMEERLGLIVSSVDELAGKIQSYLDGQEHIEGVYQRRARRKDALFMLMSEAESQEAINKWIRNKKLEKLLDLWVSGVDLDWEKFYGDTKPSRMRLPVYPFAKEHYWANEAFKQKDTDEIALMDEGFGSFEDVIDKIDQGLMDENEGVKALKLMV